MKRMSVNFAFLLLIIIMVSGRVTEATGICQGPSTAFKGGLCLSNTNCAHICINEGKEWTSGHCSILHLRCICQKPCDPKV